MGKMISLHHAAVVYQSPESEVEAVKDVSFDLEEGEFVSLVGPSGCGKSTLLSVIAGLEPLTGGTAEIGGRVITGTSPAIGLMPQQDQLFEWETIRRNVLLGLRIHGDRDPAHIARVEGLLDRYGLAAFADKRPSQLSGGMRQRCALIRTLATDPRLLLLDEPFSALDYQTRLQVTDHIWKILREQEKTALLVTHDISEAVSMSDRVIVLSRRPAVVKAVVDVGELRGLPPLVRRENPAFSAYFDQIWRELDIHA